ncbi:MAG: hypothetical protein H6995_02290 [Pseudomonadales bacterium]|nr:hypothetical protein [Pseudomonadales bacterium]MCP5213816.1 hypothetical protein [Pseudomonadales bacterium]
MPRRDEDDIDVMSGLSVDRDDARYRQQSRQGQPAAGATSNSGRATSVGIAKSNGRPWIFSLVIITLLLVCGVLAFQVWQVSSRSEATENELSSAIKRIDQLSHEVFATGSSVTQSGSVIEEKFKFFDSEIRKLWDVSYKRNKTAIEQNTDKLKTIETSLKNATGEMKTSQTKLSALEKQQTEFTAKLKQVNSQLMAENTTLRASVEDHSEQLLLLRSELEIIQNRLKDAPKDLAKRLQSNEEAIEAIDAARRQLVSSITQLQNRVNQLQSGAK